MNVGNFANTTEGLSLDIVSESVGRVSLFKTLLEFKVLCSEFSALNLVHPLIFISCRVLMLSESWGGEGDERSLEMYRSIPYLGALSEFVSVVKVTVEKVS